MLITTSGNLNQKITRWAIGTALISVGFLLGTVFTHLILNQNPENDFFEVHQKGNYTFINPLLECNIDQELGGVEMASLQEKIEKFADEQMKRDMINYISVYFRDQNNGPWFGINEDELFTPASLLKVPIMMSYFKMAEQDPKILIKKIKYQSTRKDPLQPNIVPSKTIEEGKDYTVEDLIRRMIIYSDNKALDLLSDNIDSRKLDQIYIDLGISNQNLTQEENTISVKTYAVFFRTLYNASYLNNDLSEKVLEILSKTEFKDALVAGVPPNITVSHKFGERGYILNNFKQLHDCGIVYHPKKPYLLCVMTRGDNLEELANIIKNISKLVYEEIDENY